MIDPVSLSVAAGLVWIGDKLLDHYKHNFPKPRLALA